MIVESIQRVFAVTPLYTEQTVAKTLRNPETDKTTREFIVYRVYNRLGQIEQNQQNQIDLRA